MRICDYYFVSSIFGVSDRVYVKVSNFSWYAYSVTGDQNSIPDWGSVVQVDYVRFVSVFVA